MDTVLRVQDLIRELEKHPPSAPVMVAVVKYPSKFTLDVDELGYTTWDKSEAVETCPLEVGEVYSLRDEVTLCVELVDFQEQMETYI